MNNGRLVVLSGAGLSAPSGIQTFRGNDGLWEGHYINKVCDYHTWKDNRAEVHAFYNARRSVLETVRPNDAHAMIAAWKSRYGDRATILTQNVDDLLERAGCTDVIHLHGDLQYMHCTACSERWHVGYRSWNHEEGRCPKCTSRAGVKPGVVFFNEMAPRYAYLAQAFRNLTEDDVVVVIGTSGLVIDVTSIVAKVPAFKILNNLEPSQFIDEDCFDELIYESADKARERLDNLVIGKLG